MKQVIFDEVIDGMIINRVVRDYEFTMPSKHFHSEYEIYYLVKGQRYYFIEDKSYLVNEGSLVFINHNQAHKTALVNQPYHDRIVVELRSEYLAPFFASISEFSLQTYFSKYTGILSLNAEGRSYVENLLASIAKEIQNKAPGYKLSAYIKVVELLIYSMRLREKDVSFLDYKSSSPTAKHQKVHDLTNYIAENYMKINSLDDFARQFYISKCYLSRLFKEVTGFTVNEYINIYKIKKAQELLINSSCTIGEIANMLGYNSISAFEKSFKKHLEMSPLKYRKRMRPNTKHLRERGGKGLNLFNKE